MRFFTFVATTATLLASFVSAQNPLAISAPGAGATLQAGAATTINWAIDTDAEVTLTLRSGEANNLAVGVPIATVANSGTFAWTVPANVVDGTQYTIEITDASGGANFNYSPFFSITGGTGVSSAAASSAASTKALSAAASSAAASSAASTKASATSAPVTLTTSKTSTSATSTGSKTAAAASASAAPTNAALNVKSGSIAAIVGMGALVVLV